MAEYRPCREPQPPQQDIDDYIFPDQMEQNVSQR